MYLSWYFRIKYDIKNKIKQLFQYKKWVSYLHTFTYSQVENPGDRITDLFSL